MRKAKSLIGFFVAVVLIISQCTVSLAFASDDALNAENEANTAIENSENTEEPEADKVIIGIDGYDFLGDEPYQTLAAVYGAELDDVPFPETIAVSLDGISEMVELPVEWKPADGEEWDAYADVNDENGNLVSCKLVADFGDEYVLSDELTENGASMPWIKLIHQPKPVEEEVAADETVSAEKETEAPTKAPSKVAARTASARAALPASEQSSYVFYNTNHNTTSAFEIKGVSNGSATIKTTYNQNGYTCAVKVDSTETASVVFAGNGVTKNVSGIDITQTLSIVNDGAYVKIQYDVYNPTTVAHTVGISNHCDVQINANDSAPIYPTGTGARMAESDTGSQFNIICKNAYGVTDVDNLWFGQYGQRTSHLWNSEITNTTLTGTDSGIAISWCNRTINPGQTKTFSYLLGIGKSANPPELGSEISAIVNPQTVDVSASVKDITGMVDKLYYVLDMGTSDESDPGVLDTKTGNGTFQNMGGVIQRPKTWQAGEVHTVSVWVMNEANAMSAIKTVAILIEDNEDQGDVMRPAQSATVTFAANGGSGTAPATMNAYELQTISLPNNTFTAPAGKQFGGWQDPSGDVYPAGSDYKVPENLSGNTIQLKAYWINTNESYYYLDVYEEQLNGAYKKTNATITSGTVNTAINLSASDLTVPEGFKFNASKSKLSGTIVNAANPLHLEAYFDRLDLNVTFDNGISSNANDTVTVKYGATVDESAIKTLADQAYADFGGWFTSVGGKGNAFTADRKIKDNTTVYAYWIPKELDVTFDYNYVNPRANNLASRQYSCKLNPEVNSAFELNLAGKVSSFPVEPARWQDTDGNTFRFDGWYLGDTKVDLSTLLNYEPITLTAKWVKVAAVVCVAEGNGSVTGQGFYDIGTDAEITWAAEEGYHVSHILIDGKWVGGEHVDETSHLFENIQENHNVLVTFEKDDEEDPDHDHPDVINPEDKYYLITTQKYGTSKINLTDSFSVKEGETAKVEWDVPNGYKITKVVVNGINRDQSVIDRGYVEIETVHNNHTVEVYAEPATNYVQQNGFYSIDAAINHGTITNSASVTEGSDFTVEWEIETGYHAVSVLIDGAEAADKDNNAVSFSDIKENHSVRVICEPDDPDASVDEKDKNLLINTAIYGGPGSITPSSFVSTGDDTTVKWNITAEIPEQYEIGYVYVDGEVVELDEDNNLEYTFDSIKNNHKVEVYLIPNLVQFNVTYEGKGTVSPSQTLLYATNYNLFAEPANGWKLSTIVMDGKQIYPEIQTQSLFSRVMSLFSANNGISALADDPSFSETYNVVETHNVEVTFEREDGQTDAGARIQLNTNLNGTGTISPSRLFVAGRDNADTVEWNIPDNYAVEGVFARTADTSSLTAIPFSGNSVTIGEILSALKITDDKLNFVNTIEFIVNTKPIPVPTSDEPAEYFNLTTKIDDGGNISSSLNNVLKGEVVTVNWSTDENQWVSKVIIDGEERPDLVEKNSVDITMDGPHSVEVKLNLAESKYYVDYYKQMIDGEYVLIASEPFDSRVNTAVSIESNAIQIPESYTFNSEKSVLSGTVTGASKPLHLSIYFDRILTLNVKYVDEEDNEIAEGYTETYKWGERYETRLPDERPYGYTLTETPDNASGEIKEDVVTVKYVYTLNPATVLVNYLDENGDKIPADIRDSDVITGKVNQQFKTAPAKIYGYELDTENLPVEEGTFKEEQQIVNYYYKLKDSSVKFLFIASDDDKSDEATETIEISPERIIEGKVYDDYTVLAQKALDEVLASNDVYGYELTGMPELVHNGIMTEEQTVIIYNFKQKSANVVVEYHDLNGNKICDDVVIEGKARDSYSTELKEFRDYEWVETKGNPDGTFAEEPITVTYIYDYKPTSVVVNYVNRNGETIAPSETISGKVTDDYNSEIKDIANYQTYEIPKNVNGKMTAEQITVTIVYDYKDTSVIVNHIDDAGNVLAPQSVISGKVFDEFNTEHIDITGYDFIDVKVSYQQFMRNAVAKVMALFETENSVPSDYSGIMEESVIVVDYIYSRKPAQVIVEYVDENGNLLDSETINGVYEDDYTTSAKDIYAYQFVSATDNTDGKMGIDPITVTYTYKQYLNIDTDGDGEPDVNIDTDDDGEPDVNIDTDDDGEPDVNIDTDDDGEPDVNIDTDDDGEPDVNIDTDDDGEPDVNIDTDDDGEPDVNIDTDDDGKPDVNIDTDDDGEPDVNIDTDDDGEPDVNIDTDDDGEPDVNIDTTGDGKPNVNIDKDGDLEPDVNIDTTGDGKPNVNIDKDGDLEPDVNIDTTGDGKPNINIDKDGDLEPDVNIDTTGDGKPNVNIDKDGDLEPDVNIDTTGDGKPNINIDKDGDLEPDVNIDTTGDGQPNINIDKDGDLEPDVNIDTTGDGQPNINIDKDGDLEPDINIDTTGNGVADTNIDTDGDLVPDINIDTTGDGKADSNLDTDGDGIADTNIIGVVEPPVEETVDTGSTDSFRLIFFTALSILALLLLLVINRKPRKASC